MTGYKKYFKDKKITVMGLGVLGRGVGDVKFLAECGADLIVTDLKNAEDLESSLTQLNPYSNIKFVLGEHRLEDFRDRDMVLKSAGVPLENEFIDEARRNNIPVHMSSALFSKIASSIGVKIIGITGTRGKSTVTHLIYKLLQKAQEVGSISSRHVFLGGNIQGVATLPFLSEVESGDIAVLELDSWQLQGFGDEKLSPHIAVFTTFLSDHMNYYKGNMETYLADKANIFINQKSGDSLILGSQVQAIITEKYGEVIQSNIQIGASIDVPKDWKIRIPGEHNRYNIALVLKVAEVLNISIDLVQNVVEDFTGVPGRLQYLAEVRGVQIYNDTTATMPDATLAGLAALSTNKNVVLIMGGADKKIEMTPLIEALSRYCKAVVLLPGSGTDLVSDSIKAQVPTTLVATLKEAVDTSMKQAVSGDIVLLSPAFASFGLFKNEYDRGDQFNALVKVL